jgi:ABC-type dipeptide/oligopeptide/nickel transport system permease subunit
VTRAVSAAMSTRSAAGPAAPALAVYATVGLGATVGEATALSFLGLGAPPPSPEWGAMLAPGVPYLEQVCGSRRSRARRCS